MGNIGQGEDGNGKEFSLSCTKNTSITVNKRITKCWQRNKSTICLINLHHTGSTKPNTVIHFHFISNLEIYWSLASLFQMAIWIPILHAWHEIQVAQGLAALCVQA